MKELKLPSNRSFGLTFFGFFLIVAVIGIWRNSELTEMSLGFLAASSVFLFFSFFFSQILTIPNRLWMTFAEKLNLLMTPFVFGLIYFVVITPIAFGMRIAGKDFLRIKLEKKIVKLIGLKESLLDQLQRVFTNNFRIKMKILGISAFYHDSAAASLLMVRLLLQPKRKGLRGKSMMQISQLKQSNTV